MADDLRNADSTPFTFENLARISAIWYRIDYIRIEILNEKKLNDRTKIVSKISGVPELIKSAQNLLGEGENGRDTDLRY